VNPLRLLSVFIFSSFLFFNTQYVRIPRKKGLLLSPKPIAIAPRAGFTLIKVNAFWSSRNCRLDQRGKQGDTSSARSCAPGKRNRTLALALSKRAKKSRFLRCPWDVRETLLGGDNRATVKRFIVRSLVERMIQMRAARISEYCRILPKKLCPMVYPCSCSYAAR